MKRSYILFVFLTIYVSLTVNCKRDPDPDSIAKGDSIYHFVSDVMDYWYLWNDEIPSDVDILGYSTPVDLLDTLKYKKIDKWSFIDEKEVVEQLFSQGEYKGFGFYMKWDSDDNLSVILSYANSDAYKAGIKRGCAITHINNTSVTRINQATLDLFFNNQNASMKFNYIDSDGNYKEADLTKKTIKMNGIMYQSIIEQNNKKIGYLVYDSFLQYTYEDLQAAIREFHSSQIDELVLDLRYNGGGHVYVATYLAENLVKPDKVGETYYKVVHNSNVSSTEDTTIYFHAGDNNLGLDRLFVITSGNSASASEMIINGLAPHMDVIKIGATTHGKPVGMYGFNFQDWIMFPVTNKTVNADGYGDYYNGIAPDKLADDGYEKPWGDITEDRLHQALFYIARGFFDNSVIALKSAKEEQMLGSFPKAKNILVFE